jgi:hypothetical protein
MEIQCLHCVASSPQYPLSHVIICEELINDVNSGKERIYLSHSVYKEFTFLCMRKILPLQDRRAINNGTKYR